MPPEEQNQSPAQESIALPASEQVPAPIVEPPIVSELVPVPTPEPEPVPVQGSPSDTEIPVTRLSNETVVPPATDPITVTPADEAAVAPPPSEAVSPSASEPMVTQASILASREVVASENPPPLSLVEAPPFPKEKSPASLRSAPPFTKGESARPAVAPITIDTPVAPLVIEKKPDMKALASLSHAETTRRREKRLEKITAFAREHRSIANDQVEKLVRVSDKTAERYLKELVKRGVLRKTGGKTGRGVRYEGM